jgi:energy-converting hydrogenase Eha subunit C
MPPGLRRFAWWSFFLTEAGLVAAASAYVDVATLEFWLVVVSAVVASIAYVVTVRRTPAPKLGEATAASRRWFWF